MADTLIDPKTAAKTTVLLYGRTRSGKTTQIGLLAEHVMKTTGLKTRLYTIDRGGINSIKPYVDLGIIDVVDCEGSNPWIFMNRAAQGALRTTDGKWAVSPEANALVGMYAFESMTAFADAFMTTLADGSAGGGNVGGGANVSFAVNGEGDNLKIGGNNMAHYNVVQSRITNEVWASQRLNAPFILWTASVSKDDDQVSSGKVLGPAVIGKALTAEVPRWFNLSFRIDAIPAQVGKPERHVLYLGNSLDMNAGNAVSLGNTRTPLDGGDLPMTIEPANIVTAIEKIAACGEPAAAKIKARLGLK